MRRLLTPPIFADEDKTHTARLLHIILWALVLGCVLFTPPLATIANPVRNLLMGLCTLLLSMGLLFLARRGLVRTASRVLIVLLWGLLTASAITTGGVRAPTFIGYFTVIIMTGLLLGGKAGIATTGLCTLSGLGMAYAEMRGLLPSPVDAVSPLTRNWKRSRIRFRTTCARRCGRWMAFRASCWKAMRLNSRRKLSATCASFVRTPTRWGA